MLTDGVGVIPPEGKNVCVCEGSLRLLKCRCILAVCRRRVHRGNLYLRTAHVDLALPHRHQATAVA